VVQQVVGVVEEEELVVVVAHLEDVVRRLEDAVHREGEDHIQDLEAPNEEGQDQEHGPSRETGMNGVIVQFLMSESVQKREDQHPKRRVQKKKDQDHQTGHAPSLMMSMHRKRDHDQEVVPGLDQTTMTILNRTINSMQKMFQNSTVCSCRYYGFMVGAVIQYLGLIRHCK